MRKRNYILKSINQENQEPTNLIKEELPQEVLINKVKNSPQTKILGMAQTQALVDGIQEIMNSSEFKQEDVPAMEAYVNKFFIQPMESNMLEESLNRLENLKKFMDADPQSDTSTPDDVFTAQTYRVLYREATMKVLSYGYDMSGGISDGKDAASGVLESSLLFGFRGSHIELYRKIFATMREIIEIAKEGKFLSCTTASVGINGAMNIFTSFNHDVSFDFHQQYIGPGYGCDLVISRQNDELNVRPYIDRDYDPISNPITIMEGTIQNTTIFMRDHLEEYTSTVRSIAKEIQETTTFLASYVIKPTDNPYAEQEGIASGNYYLEKNAAVLIEILEQLKQNLYTTTETILKTLRTPIVQCGIHTNIDYTDRLAEMGL